MHNANAVHVTVEVNAMEKIAIADVHAANRKKRGETLSFF